MDTFSISPELKTYLHGVLTQAPSSPPPLPPETWETFLKSMSSQGILPYLYYILRPLPKNIQPPNPSMQTLRDMYFARSVTVLKHENALSIILSALAEAGIEPILLKGLAFAHTLYPSPACRPYSDLDLLVNPTQIQAAKAQLKKIGFICIGNQSKDLKDLEIEDQYIHQSPAQNFPSVEIHWALHGCNGIMPKTDVQNLFARSQKIKIGKSDVLILSPVDALVHAAIHQMLIHDNTIRLIWLLDIAMLTKKINTADEWKLFIKEASKQKCVLPVKKALSMAAEWFQSPIPQEVSATLRPTRAEIRNFNIIVKRHTNFFNWLYCRWPRNLSPWQQIKLFYHTFNKRILHK